MDQIVNSGNPPLSRLDELLHCLASLIANDPPYRAMQELALFREEWWQELKDIYESHQRFISFMDQKVRQLFRELVEAGRLPPSLDDRLAADFCEAFLSGIGILKQVLGAGRKIDPRRMIDFFMKGLLAQ